MLPAVIAHEVIILVMDYLIQIDTSTGPIQALIRPLSVQIWMVLG